MTLDLKKALDCYRAVEGEFRTLVVPPLEYLMVDGHGDPNTAPEYADALATLYPLAYALKRASKRELAATTWCRPWRRCGGPTTWPRSPRGGTRAIGTGRRC